MSMRRIQLLAAAGGIAIALAAGSSAAAGAWPAASSPSQGGHWGGPGKAAGALMSTGSPSNVFQRNLQAEPALAIDPVKTDLVAATANDLVDMQPCSKKASVTAGACGLPATPDNGGSFSEGVGMTGVYFSFNSGHSWTQPVYHGLTAAGCNPTMAVCKAKPGPIHTVPQYYEHGLRTRGDSSVAFGPVLKNGKFSWANGSRLYLSSLATNLTDTAIRPGSIDSNTTVTVSHVDNPTAASVTRQQSWSAPVIVPKTQPAISLPTEDQIWADNVSSSKYFGNVYMCFNDLYFPSSGTYPIYPTVAVSSDGGQTWTTHNVAAPIDSPKAGYRLGCAIRTDSHGEVYAVFTRFPGEFPSTGLTGSQTLVTSADGGATWTKPDEIIKTNTGCFYVDPTGDRCAEEGPGGTPNEPGPSLTIANGAPTGAGATNEIVLGWTDGRDGLNHEGSFLSYSMDQAKTWSTPVRVSVPSDRSLYTAVAIAPNADHLYLTYNAFTTPFTKTTLSPHLLHGVLRSAAIRPDGAPFNWTTDYVGRSGDARGTAFGGYNYEEFLGFYISAAATRDYGIGSWTDVRRAANCPAMNAWREASLKAVNVVTPAPWPLAACPANFGNSDIWSATTAG